SATLGDRLHRIRVRLACGEGAVPLVVMIRIDAVEADVNRDPASHCPLLVGLTGGPTLRRRFCGVKDVARRVDKTSREVTSGALRATSRRSEVPAMSLPLLRPGQTHEAVPKLKEAVVRELQALNESNLASAIKINVRTYGPRTVKAVKAFQQAKTLDSDGV